MTEPLMVTEEEARREFEAIMAAARHVFDKIPRRIARGMPSEKRFLVERILRVEIEKFLAGWDWARFLAMKADEVSDQERGRDGAPESFQVIENQFVEDKEIRAQ